MNALSVYEEGLREAERHKWIESEKRGADLGETALGEWYRRHWAGFCRSKCLEHLVGSQSWKEFAHDDFGLIERLLVADDLLLDRILDRIQFGMENLDVIGWSLDWGISNSRVREILTQLDINRARLQPT